MCVVCDLGEGVDSQDGEVGLRLGVVHEIEIHQLLQLQIVSLHAVDHIRKQRAARTSIGIM